MAVILLVIKGSCPVVIDIPWYEPPPQESANTLRAPAVQPAKPEAQPKRQRRRIKKAELPVANAASSESR